MKNWFIKNMCMLSVMLVLLSIGVAVITCFTLEKGVRPTTKQDIILFFCSGVMISQIMAGLFSRWLPCWYACDGMGWHISPNEISFMGCGHKGCCPRCGKEVMQDSQGNWF